MLLWGGSREAALILGDLGDARAVEPLIAALRVPYSAVREGAAVALGKLGDPRACEPLAQMIQRPDIGSEKCQAALALGKCGPNAMEPLVAALEGKDHDLRCAAAQGLGVMRDERAVGPLMLALRDRGIRHAVCKGLVQMGTLAVEPLIGALKDKDKEVQISAAGVLGELGDKQSVEPLIGILTNENDNLKVLAAGILRKIRDERAVEPLIRWGLLKARKQRDGRPGPEISPAMPALIAALRAGDVEAQRDAVVALAEVGPLSEEGMSALVGALGNQDATARHLACRALLDARPLHQGHVAALRACADSADPVARAAAVEFLGGIQPISAETLTVLIRALDDQEPRVQMKAADAVGAAGPAASAATKALIRLLQNKQQGEVRQHAAGALGKMGPTAKDAVPALIEAVDDDDLWQTGSRSLGAMGWAAADAVPALCRRQSIRIGGTNWAAWALGQLREAAKTAGDRTYLVRTLKDRNPDVRNWAASTLRLMGPDMLKALEAEDAATSRPLQLALLDSIAANLRREGHGSGLLRTDLRLATVRDDSGIMLIHVAAQTEDNGMVTLLLSNGAQVDAKDEDGFTPLCWAAKEGHPRTVQFLLDKGADPKVAAKGGVTALHLAAGMESDRWSMTASARRITSRSPSDRPKVIELLLARGVEVDVRTNDGSTALHAAAEGGTKGIAELLISRGADVNATTSDGQTPLHLAASSGRLDLVESLVAKGAKIEAKNKAGLTPLDLAAMKNRVEVVRRLLDMTKMRQRGV